MLALVGFVKSADPVTAEEGRDIACLHYTDDGWTKYDLRPLERLGALTPNIHSDDYYFQDHVEFNFCSYLQGKDYFASLTTNTGGSVMDLGLSILTNSDYKPKVFKPFPTSENFGDVDGVTIQWESNETCATGGTNSFKAKITCDQTNDV